MILLFLINVLSLGFFYVWLFIVKSDILVCISFLYIFLLILCLFVEFFVFVIIKLGWYVCFRYVIFFNK